MELNSQTNGIIGRVSITKTNINGDILEKIYIPNLVVTVGKNYIASRMVDTSQSVMTNMALGSSVVAAALGDTTLGTELGRIVLSAATFSGAVVTYTATFPAGTATGAITEAGILNAGTAGILLCRTVFPVVNKGASDIISVTWTITIS